MSADSISTLEKIINSRNIKSLKFSVYGIILDSTRSYKTLDSRDFVTKIKIFDNTLNYKKKVKNQEFVYVFIYSENLENCPFVDKIGDIIFLKNFDFSIYEDKVKGTFNKFNSSWFIYDKDKNSGNKAISSSKGNFVTDVNKKELDKVRDISLKFFQENNLEKFSWFVFDFPKKIAKEKVIKIEDVDIIVKLVTDAQVVIQDNCFHKLLFIDVNKNKYYSEYNGTLSGLSANSVVKLRSVNIYLQSNEKKIEFRTYSNILFLDKNFLNSKKLLETTKSFEYKEEELKLQHFSELHLEEMEKKKIGKNTFEYGNMEEESDNILEEYPLLKNYNYNEKETNRGSVILKKHNKLNVSSLSEVKKSFDSKKVSSKDIFRVNCNISKVLNDFSKMIKISSKKKKKTWDLKDYNKAVGETKDLEIVLSNNFTLKEGKQQLDVVFSSEHNNSSFFDVLNLLPDLNNLNSWKSLDKQVYNNFNKMLKKLENKLDFEFILKVNEVEKKKELVIVDSILSFIN